MRFDMPRGDAVETLKEVAKQAEVGVLFVTTELEGLQTDALSGEYGVRAALDMMLADTPFVAVQVSGENAFAIVRSDKSTDRRGDTAELETETKFTNKMNLEAV